MIQYTWDSPFYIFRDYRLVFFYLKTFFTFTNSVDTDEMQQNAAFHLVLPYLQKYSFRGFPNTKGYGLLCVIFHLY